MGTKNTEIIERSIIESNQKEGQPPMYRVILHNDDYTTMEFVVEILINIFGKSLENASEIMLNIHRKGKDTCGVYSYEVAETKVSVVHRLAREKGFPLKSTMEKE